MRRDSKSWISIIAHVFHGNHRLNDGNDFITASFFIDFSFVLAYYATMGFPGACQRIVLTNHLSLNSPPSTTMTCCRPPYLCRFLPAALLLLLTVSGCTPTDDMRSSSRFLADYSAELELDNSRLANQLAQVQTEKSELEQQLQHQKQLTAQLQLGLLKKHARINELLQQNKELADDFVRSRSEVIPTNNKVETVRLLAETTAIIETLQGDTLPEKSRDIKETAKDYLDEGRRELHQGNYEKASYLAYQALDIVSTMVISSAAEEKTEVSEVRFALHLPMKTLKTCHIRAEPTMNSKILGIKKKGDIVSAAGFKRNWVKVKHGTSGHGWIHSSLLNTILK